MVAGYHLMADEHQFCMPGCARNFARHRSPTFQVWARSTRLAQRARRIEELLRLVVVVGLVVVAGHVDDWRIILDGLRHVAVNGVGVEKHLVMD